ncbi:hypothetical protein ACH4F6_11445 [Streptomyces sp. NPDC017936]|uniref:hypothetical protein n=1 Tax=Streptomyces sp. NPDC017936 TaxID=3365016 RepID=UPI003788612D
MPVDQHDPFEDRLSAALHQAGGAFDADRAALAAAGRVRGRRLRLRRRAAVAGGAAGLALVGVGGALLVPSDGDGTARNGSVAAAGSGRPTATAVPAVSADEMVRTLTELLPEGEVTRGAARGTNGALPPFAQVVFDDGKGAGSISLLVDRVTRGSGNGEAFDPAAEVTPCPEMQLPDAGPDSCVTQTLPDGSAVTLVQGYEYPDRRADTKAWSADLVTPAGQRVSVSEWNSPAEKGEPVSRPEPPLTLDQLKTLAAAQEWRRVADAIPEKTRKPSPATSDSAGDTTGFGGRRILAVLTDSLPDGLEVVSSDHQETEFAYAVVDDGEGRSYVQVNMQHDMSDAAAELYGSDAETLPDGTRVTTRQGPGEKGGEGVVMWTVDTMRADGRRVVVSAFNSGSQTAAATRPEPALTVAQLREIALSPQWEVLGG